jgi:predicted nucleic acid-binding protein
VSSEICVDASFAIKLVLPEADSHSASYLWASWSAHEVRVLAPCHLVYEVVSVIRNHVFRTDIELEDGQRALEAFLAQDIELVHPNGFEQRAWELAQRFDRPTAYDAYYLAVAEAANCELWTADSRLYRAVHDSLEWVRLLGTT